ncbi:MAG: helix-turn-helix domain-containing protein [Halioglobus sp.]
MTKPASVPASTTSTRDLILNAAENLFASQGYGATTIKQVAEQVGVQGPALYKHFTSKRALFEEVLERLFTPFLALMEDAARGGSLDAMLKQHLANPNASRIVQHATLSGGEDLALLVERWYLPFFGEVTRAGSKKARSRATQAFTPVAVMALHSMLLGYLTLAPLHRSIFGLEPLSDDALGELLDLQQRFAKAASPH